jgi:hypothetical protein
MDRLESNLEKAQNQTSADWMAFREKVKSDRQQFKAKLGERKEAFKAFFADSSAEDRELGAAIAIDYAISSIQQARLAVLDAASARAEAVMAERKPATVS